MSNGDMAYGMRLDSQLNAQRAILKQAEREGNQIAAKKAKNKIKEIEREIKRITN